VQWWAHLVGALRVHPHKHANYPPQKRSRMVERAPHANHGRVIEARLTKRGCAKVQGAHATVFGIEEQMLSEITAAGRRTLNETLRRLVENLSTSEE
jgi:DNA-binding MarR family transcriptional regulator